MINLFKVRIFQKSVAFTQHRAITATKNSSEHSKRSTKTSDATIQGIAMNKRVFAENSSFKFATDFYRKLKYQYLNALPPMNSRIIERVGTASAGIKGNASKNRRRRHASEYSRWEGVMHRNSGSAYIFKTESS